MSTILPGGTLGFLGGGQLGRMAAIAAREMGYHVRVLDPDPSCAAHAVADGQVVAAFDDADAARTLARTCDVVSYEIERISPEVLDAVAAEAPLRPGAHVLRVVQDRDAQKRWLEQRMFSIGPWRPAEDIAALAAALSYFAAPCRIKAARGGYDGRAQVRAQPGDDAAAIWHSLGDRPCVVELELGLLGEVSVFVARRPNGDTVAHPMARNWHEDGILDTSLLPAALPEAVEHFAQRDAMRIAEALGIEGVLVVEFFLAANGALLVNELAPRPHNTYHHAEAACATGQFEQYVRALCDLPLGDPRLLRPTALANLLGDLWREGRTPHFHAALAVPGVQVHLYGKEPRPKRKVGHLIARGDTAEQALERLAEARRRLGDPMPARQLRV